MPRRHRRRDRNMFNLSHQFKCTTKMGRLFPVLCEEVVPSDQFSVKLDAVVRFAPLLAPLMHEVDVFTHYYFVPNRLVWSDWESFITGGEQGVSDAIHPYITAPDTTGFNNGSLADYFGMRTGVPGYQVSALPFRAYNLIYNEWFRQQDLQDPVDISLESGEDTTTSIAVLQRNWNRDYFTSSLPYPQKGPAVSYL